MVNKNETTYSDKLIELYTHYRISVDATEMGGQLMPYRWYKFPDQLSGGWLPYVEMLGEYALDLANIINRLTDYVHRLRVWHTVVDAMSEDDRFAAKHEFLDTLGTVALGLPYAIKSRFAFAAGHLSHQANRAKDVKMWKDSFPSCNLYLNDIEPFCKKWKAFRSFKLRVEPIAGKSFQKASHNFRHAYNHGFSSHFLIGISGVVTRISDKDGKVVYNIGETEPMSMSMVADVLEVERNHCYRAFQKFQALVFEQIAAIEAADATE